MNKNYLKRSIPLIGLLLLLLGCQRDDICPASTQTTPMLILSFYDIDDRESYKRPTNLSVRSIVSDSVKTLYQRINPDTIQIPLRTNQNTTTYTFTLYDAEEEDEDPEFTPDTDTLTFTYGTEEVYVNRACAYKVIYNSLKLTIEGGEDGEWIDSYIIEEPNIEDDTESHINIFFSILFLFLAGPVLSQATAVKETSIQDSLADREKFGLRVGADISKLLRTAFQDDYSGFEILGDYRVYKNYYAAAELGNESIGYTEDNISLTSRGSYVKLGIDYNAYENWTGMENLIFVGARYGFSTFSQDVEEYQIYTTNPFFEPDVRSETIEYSGLTANWVELIAGIKVEVINNLFLSFNVQLKRRLFQTTPDNFDNLAIPGFNRTYDDSNIGVGYGYTISYLIPFIRNSY